jgi:hypothetical protein
VIVVWALRAGIGPDGLLDRLAASIPLGRAHFHHHDVRRQGPDHGYGFEAVSRLTDHLDIRLVLEEAGQALPEYGLVIDEDDFDHFSIVHWRALSWVKRIIHHCVIVH